MIGTQSVLAVICARGGSKGLPRKNVLPVGGKPVVAWSVAAGHGSAHVDRTILSSDDPEIIEVARAHGCDVPFVRPAEFATDEVAIGPVLVHALDAVAESYDWLVLLQATSPLRTSADIDSCLELAVRTGAPAVISVTRPAKSPYWMCSLDGEGRMRPILEAPTSETNRRQLLPEVFVPNGAVYVARTDWFRRTKNFASPETRAYIMPAERSVDIDYRIDLVVADALLTSP
jgi:CMP-N,N'-diacetyllegionaminic acid synthase